MEKPQIQQQCSGCAYKQPIPGDAHISCRYNWGKASLININPPRGNPHGIANGWFLFPFCYDPVWMIEECHGLAKEADPEMTVAGDTFSKIIALLGRK